MRAAVEHVEQRMKSSSLPALKSPAAYLRDALKKQYASDSTDGAGEGGAAAAPPVAIPSVNEKLQRLRDEWHHKRWTEAKSLYGEMPDKEQKALTERFETERLGELASPIAKAWRKDGVNSRIAASTFFRWVAADMWPGEVTDTQLLEFAMARGL